MSSSKIGTQLGKTKKFSSFRCPRCRSSLIPLTEEKMNVFGFTPKQREKVRQYGLNYFCLNCSRGYQRQEKPLSQESANCPICGSEMHFVEYKGELIDVFWCEECEEAFLLEMKS